jgi:succinoglycan biosynthesis transport protein ExoP
LFESYLAKYREANARDSIAAAPADARIISHAIVSNVPYFPKKIPIVLITALGTLCLAAAFVVTGAVLSGDGHRPAPQQLDVVAPARSPHARTRATDRLPPAAALPVPAAEAVASSPSPATVDDIAAALRQAGDAGRQVAVIGSARNVGTTTTAIALGRALARSARAVLVDLALSAPNVDVISDEPNAPGIADLIHGTAAFGDIITKDRFSRLHLVAAGQVGDDTQGLLHSQMLTAAVGALAQSYDHLIIDAGAPETALDPVVAMATRAVLVAGETPAETIEPLVAQLRSIGFADVVVLTGPPPGLDHAVTQAA